MVTKKMLLTLIADLDMKYDVLYDRVKLLEKEMSKPKPVRRGENIDGVKRRPGRPRRV